MEGRITKLRSYQTQDPARGSFLVHPLPVKKKGDKIKTVRNPNYVQGRDDPIYKRLEVFRAANHIERYPDGEIKDVEAHPEAFEFVVLP